MSAKIQKKKKVMTKKNRAKSKGTMSRKKVTVKNNRGTNNVVRTKR